MTKLEKFPHIDWSKCNHRELYLKNVKKEISTYQYTDTQSICNVNDATEYVNKSFESITGILHKCTAVSCHQKNSSSTYDGNRPKKHWWDKNCSVTKSRVKFWYSIWSSCNRPREGHVFLSYKLAKKSYRKACKNAVDSSINKVYNTISNFHTCKRSGKMWNLIRKLKNGSTSCYNDISIEELHKYYADKFSCTQVYNDTILAAKERVMEKLHSVNHVCFNNITFYEERLKRYIDKMKCGSAYVIDGITAEHLKYALNCDELIHHLCVTLTICVKYGIVPESFKNGLLIPILKKPTCDVSVPKSYRPIVISTTYSKLMEMYILEESGCHEFHDSQFGFISGRGTNMAASFTHDVISYNVNRGTPIFACSLDAEGAFDAIPHDIIFDKALDVVPDPSWRVLYHWYTKITVQIRWNNVLSNPIKIEKGTRQGGLSSPFLFNLFYQDLIVLLSNAGGGVKIRSHSYNVFCYADDILLTSSTVTGLQNLITLSDDYITSHGLRFNPTKTQCVIYGKNTFVSNPLWYLNNVELQVANEITYLGICLSNNPSGHSNMRIKACRKAFYALQSSGLCNGGVSPNTMSHIWNVAVQSVLTYGIQCIPLKVCDIQNLDKTQTRLLKSALGLSKYCKNTALLQALKVHKVSDLLKLYTLDLLKCHLFSNSASKHFYMFLTRQHSLGVMKGHNDLISRCKSICNNNQISLWKYMFDVTYATRMKRNVKQFVTNDGLIDSITTIFNNYNCDNYKMMLSMLLMPF